MDRAAEKDPMGSGPRKGVSLAIIHAPQSRLLLDLSVPIQSQLLAEHLYFA